MSKKKKNKNKKKLTDKQVERILKKNLKIFNKTYENNLNITNKKPPKNWNGYGFDFVVFLDDGMISVHQTTRDIDDPYYGSNNKRYRKAKKRCGKENLKRMILRFANGPRRLNRNEKKDIKKFHACDRRIGYNILPGASRGDNTINAMFIPEVVERAARKNRRNNKTKNGKLIIKKKTEKSRKTKNTELGKKNTKIGIEKRKKFYLTKEGKIIENKRVENGVKTRKRNERKLSKKELKKKKIKSTKKRIKTKQERYGSKEKGYTEEGKIVIKKQSESLMDLIRIYFKGKRLIDVLGISNIKNIVECPYRILRKMLELKDFELSSIQMKRYPYLKDYDFKILKRNNKSLKIKKKKKRNKKLEKLLIKEKEISQRKGHEKTGKKVSKMKWYTNGKKNIRLTKEQKIPKGFYLGYTNKKSAYIKSIEIDIYKNGKFDKTIRGLRNVAKYIGCPLWIVRIMLKSNNGKYNSKTKKFIFIKKYKLKRKTTKI